MNEKIGFSAKRSGTGEEVKTGWEQMGSSVEKSGKKEKVSFDIGESGEKERVREVLREVSKFFLESSGSVVEATERTACVIGVEAGVKPAGLVGFQYDGEKEDEYTKFEGMLQNLDIKFNVKSRGAYQYYFIGKEMEKVDEVEETFEELWKKAGQGVTETDERLGRLLGYPETAVRHVALGKGKNDKMNKRRDVLVVHDPGHFQEEYDAYERPIYEIMDECCPELSRVRGRERDGGVGKRILGLLGKLKKSE